MRSCFLLGLLVGGVGALDWLTGAQVSVALLYLVLVSLTGWYLGRTPAVILAVWASVVWFVADYPLREQSHWASTVWLAVTMLSTFGGMGVAMAMLRKEREQLRISLDHLAQLHDLEAINARTDSLTGLQNSRAFSEALEKEWARFLRHELPVSMAFIDVDNFKTVNDSLGHERGDQLLQQLAKGLQAVVRKEDVVGRLGGDEFGVLLPGSSSDEGRRVAQRYLDFLLDVQKEYPGIDLGASIGVASASKTMPDSRALVRAADAAMCQVKLSGKRGLAIDYSKDGRLTVLRPSPKESAVAES